MWLFVVFPRAFTSRVFPQVYAALIFAGPHGPDWSLLPVSPTLPDSPAVSVLLGVPLGTVLGAWAACVSLSRVAVGRHFLSDVAAGGALGALVAVSPYPTVPVRGLVRQCLAGGFLVEVKEVNGPRGAKGGRGVLW